MPTPAPTPEYTPPVSEESAHESGILATPERTPTPSVTSEEPTPSDTKEEENVFEPINEEPPKEEETIDQVGLWAMFSVGSSVTTKRVGLSLCYLIFNKFSLFRNESTIQAD